MKVELRADGKLHLSGYVNVTGKMSRPVITGKGRKVIEVIEERAFTRALARAENIVMTKDHNANMVLCETKAGTLHLKEDAIGLYVDADVNDGQTIAEARAGKLRGWSFGMCNIVDSIEERADKLPLRTVKDFDLDHITLVVHKTPVYAATSIEMRADDHVDELECRAGADNAMELVGIDSGNNKCNSTYQERYEKLKQDK